MAHSVRFPYHAIWRWEKDFLLPGSEPAAGGCGTVVCPGLDLYHRAKTGILRIEPRNGGSKRTRYGPGANAICLARSGP